jgi:hypothetical protein
MSFRDPTVRPPNILIQCSIEWDADNWHVGRFSMLADELSRWGRVVARNRVPDSSGVDPVLEGLDRGDFDEVWMLGVDGGAALSAAECNSLNRFHRGGGGVLTARDHANMGMWLRALEGVGSANFFHESTCWEPDPSRRCPDDLGTPSIGWPNYHSGRNGDVQPVSAVLPIHPLLRNPDKASNRIEWFPAHPHEGAVCPPPGDPRARSVARGRSLSTGRTFDLVVAFDRTPEARGRAVAHSSFHHFADYNWDTSKGAPSFVSEPEGDAIRRDPHLIDDIRTYLKNCVEWLRPEGKA